ncbi:MAG TPA: type II 3-dehydroquinate dehydratase [Oculatellaceae cyanobacterium]|jgi:3-dehydroquinate dehydratase-2
MTSPLFSPADILVLNGPNLNLLGQREPHLYGTETLDDINTRLKAQAEASGKTIAFFQSNHEGDLIDAIHQARQTTHGLIINPGGYSHTSVALRDALAAYPQPIIEVHLSNIHKREGFRHHSYISAVATGVICGLGSTGYSLALDYLLANI